MDRKKVVIIISVVLIFLILVVAVFVWGNKEDNINQDFSGDFMSGDDSLNEPENFIVDGDGRKINVSENINKESIVVGDFELKDISLEYFAGQTRFLATVQNNSEIDYKEGANITIIFYDSNGNVLVTVPAITSSLLSNGTSSINAKITGDYSNAADIEVKVDI